VAVVPATLHTIARGTLSPVIGRGCGCKQKKEMATINGSGIRLCVGAGAVKMFPKNIS
jgi:hypothetical protein